MTSNATETARTRFIRVARLCRSRDLERLYVLGELVNSLSELIHALQKERGASSIVLGSAGADFTDRLAIHIAQSNELERDALQRLEHIDEKLDQLSLGARFYTRGAHALRALQTLGHLRTQIASLSIAPQDAVKGFSDIIACLLAVGFEVADIAADPEISRVLIALANFSQGKEYAGQERATAGAGFSRGRIDSPDQQRLQHLIVAQEQAFRVFVDFCLPDRLAAFQDVLHGADSLEVKRMRKIALGKTHSDEPLGVTAQAWFDRTTRRIDALKSVEEQITADLSRLCTDKLVQSRLAMDSPDQLDELTDGAPVAMLVAEEPAAGVGLYTLEGALPKPMRSILDVVQAQSRRLNDVNHQLESARAALVERKTIERAKGLLMASRRLSEKDAYSLMRETAMRQNKRIYEIAEAVLSMAEIL